MPITKTCLFCIKEFTNKKTLKAKYCSNECRLNHVKQLSPKIEISCQQCQAKFLTVPSNSKAKFCSHSCAYVPLFKNCLTCKKDFKVKQSEFKKKKYCSYKCKYPNYKLLKKNCLSCGKEFETLLSRNSHYCSHICHGKSQNTGIIKICAGCTKEFYVKNHLREEKKYCSRKCRIKGIYKVCTVCGKQYLAHATYAATSKFCSNDCRFIKFNSAQSALAKNPNLRWCSAGKHTFTSKSDKRSSCNDCGKIDTQIRQLRSRKAKGKFTFEQWQEKIKFWGGRCYLCLNSLTQKAMQIEHRIPISRGGTNWIANIAPACVRCNASKHNKTEKEFREWRNKRNRSTIFA